MVRGHFTLIAPVKKRDQKYYGLFNDSFPPIIDGVTLTVVNYASYLEKMGKHPLIVTPHNPEPCPTSYPQMRYFSLPIWNRHPYRYGYPKLDFRIWSKLRNCQFEIVHSHSPFSAGRLALYAARHHHIPLVGTFHSKYRTDLEHSFRRTPWMTKIIMRRIRSFFDACDEIWIPQAKVKDTVREYGIRGKVIVMENGNDFAGLAGDNPKQFKIDARRDLEIPEDTFSLLFVGQHIWEKGIGIIADALAEIKGKIKFRMDFIGTGYAAEDLKKRIDRYGLNDNVFIHGSISDRSILIKHYAAADLFLFPSFYDNAPLVVREAAAFSTPSVLLKGSTASELISDGVNGFLTDRTPKDYAEMITHLSASPHILEEAGNGARCTLVRSWENVMHEVTERYRKIIKDYKNN